MKHPISSGSRSAPSGPLSELYPTVDAAGSVALLPSEDDANALTTLEALDLQRRVALFLKTSHIPGLRHVSVTVDADAVVLSGEVNTYYEKQMAVQFASRVAGVIRILDFLTVRSYAPLSGRDRIDAAHWTESVS